MSRANVINIHELFGNKVKPTNERFGLRLLRENMDNNNLVSDIGDVDYTHGEQMLGKNNLRSISEPFCDNIMIVKICDDENCASSKKNNFIVNKEQCGEYNSYLRGKFGKFVAAKDGVKAKLPFRLDCDNKMAKGTVEIIGESGMEIIKKKYRIPVGIPYKVELADIQLDVVLEELPAILKELEVQDFYLLDFDISQDFAGIFNKKEMIRFLIQNDRFCQKSEYKENCYVIHDTDKTVGNDSLKWTISNVRIKIYNKFICQITSPGVNKSIGNHILDYIKCPDERLNTTFASPLAKEHGITRLEITIYNYAHENYCKSKKESEQPLNIPLKKKVFDPLKDCLKLLEENKGYLQKAPFYSVSISRMWTKLTDSIQNSCCVVFKNMLQYAFWGNGHTQKLTGLQTELPTDGEDRDKKIKYVISAFSFNNLPVNYLEILEDDLNRENVNFTQKCYKKTGETYFSRSTKIFSVISEEVNLENVGLIKTKNIIPQILRKRRNKTDKYSPPFAFEQIVPPSKVYVKSAKKRQEELEEINLNKRKKEYLAKMRKTIALKEESKLLMEKALKVENETIQKVKEEFKRKCINLNSKGFYKIYAFTVIKNKTKDYLTVTALAETNGHRNTYYIKGLSKNKLIDIYNNRNKQREEGFIYVPFSRLELLLCPFGHPFITFNTNGTDTYNGYTFARIENLTTGLRTEEGNSSITLEETEKILNLRMGKIEAKIDIKKCLKLEEFQESTEWVINGLKEIKYRNKERYILQFEYRDGLYVSNHWFEKEIQDADIDLNFKIYIKMDMMKKTPTNIKERVVFLA